MKKIIAAALSILVGAFGYTIVDSAIEDRVATLESEVVELREEVSRYHPQSSWFTTAPNSTNRTTDYYTTSTTGYRTTLKRTTTTRKNTTTKKHPSTTFSATNTWSTESLTVPMCIGDFLKESQISIHKYLIREHLYGGFEYISPERYTSVPIYTRPLEGDNRTYANMVVAENYVYVTESTAQITDISENVSYSYYYDKDYSQNSTAHIERLTSISIKCKGYTDISLAGKKVVFSVYWRGNSRPDTIISNTIKADGTFEYEAIYSCRTELMNYQAEYRLTSISVS